MINELLNSYILALLDTRALPSVPSTSTPKPEKYDKHITVIIIVTVIISLILLLGISMLTLSRTDGIQKLLRKTAERPYRNQRYKNRLLDVSETVNIKGFDRTLRPKDQAFYLGHNDSKTTSSILYNGKSEQYLTPQENSRYVFGYDHAFNSSDTINITGFDHTLRPEHRSFYLEHAGAKVNNSFFYNGVHKDGFKQ